MWHISNACFHAKRLHDVFELGVDRSNFFHSYQVKNSGSKFQARASRARHILDFRRYRPLKCLGRVTLIITISGIFTWSCESVTSSRWEEHEYELEQHSVEIQEFFCHSNLRDINFGMVIVSKIPIFTVLETQDYEFWKIWALQNCTNSPKSKFRSPKMVKKDSFESSQSTKIDFTGNRWQKNHRISTLWAASWMKEE